MDKLKVLIVDDSPVVRSMLSQALSASEQIEVCGMAPNGVVALKMIARDRPNLVTMDVEMPEMGGMQTLTEIKKRYPDLPVIMISSHTVKGAAITMEALILGASDYVPKPDVSGPEEAQRRISEELIPKVLGLCGRESFQDTPYELPNSVRTEPGQKIHAVVIGISTGGPNILNKLLPQLPGTLPVPILIVQHMPALFTRVLAERLGSRCRLPVHEGLHGDPVRNGHIYLAPGDTHMETPRAGNQVYLKLHREAHENSCRPSVDVLFRSAARDYGAQVLGVVMTGMGRDGLVGANAIVRAGGRVIVQDQESSVVWSMPGGIVRAGLADAVLPPDQILSEILNRVGSARDKV